MQTPSDKIAAIDQALAQIRLWSEIQAENASPRQPDHIGDELLDACKTIVQGLNELPSLPPEFSPFPDIALTHVQAAQIRAAFAGIVRIKEDAEFLRDAVGHDILSDKFPGYNDIFVLLGDAVKMTNNAEIPPENRDKFLAWTAENRTPLTTLHKQMLACKSAAIAAKRRERRNFWLAVAAATGLGGVVIAIIGALAD